MPSVTPPGRLRKRSRTASTGPGNKTSTARDLRAKSLFRCDKAPYLPGHDKGKDSLAASTDWDFRLEVVCSDQPSESIFKKAVQGLVKICFPDDVLEELGIDVVEQHMREAQASEDKLARMRDVFGSELVHCCAWMMAKYMDSPEKVAAGIASIVTASNRLHGEKLDSELLDDIIGGLKDLRNQLLLNGSSEMLNGAGLNILFAPAEKDQVSPSQDHMEDEAVPNCETEVGGNKEASANKKVKNKRRLGVGTLSYRKLPLRLSRTFSEGRPTYSSSMRSQSLQNR